jgi:HD-like signal output (HDOD) protein
VTSIQRASLVLGHKILGELITMGGAASLLSNQLVGYGLDAGALWKHSLAVAFGSKIIANKIEPLLSNDAFTSGLIHNSGKLILDSYIQERWELFEEFMADGELTFLDAEKKILELDHTEVAAEVCKTWNIPKPFTVAIRYHHSPSRSNDSKLAYIVHVADAIAMMAGLGLGIDGKLYQMDDKAMEFLGIQEEDVNEIMGKILEAAQNISEQ